MKLGAGVRREPSPDAATYTCAGTGCAKTGLATTTYLNAPGRGVVTTTYGYDAFGTRVLQIGTSTTTIYPVKWYSVASSTGSGAKYATTTEYVFNGDTLLATIDPRAATQRALRPPTTFIPITSALPMS